MAKKFEEIEQALDVDVETTSKDYIENVRTIIKKPMIGDEIEGDSKYTRDNLYDLVEKGQEAIYEMLEIAKETQKARDFEVVGQLIKSVADVSDKLLDLQTKKKKLKEEDIKTNVTNNTTNALFVGSTADLQKFLKDSMKNSK